MDIRTLQSIRRILLDQGLHPIRPCLQDAARFLSATTSHELLGSLVSNPLARERMLAIVSHLDHVGFIAFASTSTDICLAAEAAGFVGRLRTFPSRIVARELGELAGVDTVPTTIFKAHGITAAGASIAVEIFMPAPVDPGLVRDWIERGCAVHVALAIADPVHFREIIDIMVNEGFRPPAFAGGKPLTNDEEHLIALYFDGRLHGQSLRVEFCHFNHAATGGDGANPASGPSSCDFSTSPPPPRRLLTQPCREQ